jgi:CubicO group peptidase (beta-lactamase class C family)
MATDLRARAPRNPLNAGSETSKGGGPDQAGTDPHLLQQRMRAALSRRPAVGFAMAVVRPEGRTAFEAHGLADIASQTPVAEDTVFRIASITKTFTAIAVMQLWEQGRLDLDAPANDYLRAYTLVPGKPAHRPATVRDLLTHSAGVPEQVPRSGVVRRDYGESFAPGRVPTPAEYYRGGLRLEAEPGTQFIYGDHSPSTLGQIVEDVSGTPLDVYVRDHIFTPLGMVDSEMVRSDRVAARLATGYTIGCRGATEVPYREWVTKGATNVFSTPRDMARYVAALLGGGANAHGRVVQPATLAMMCEPQYQPDPRIDGIGLAFYRGNVGGHTLIEHLGVLPGFNAQVVAVPEDGVGVIAFTNGGYMASMWLKGECETLLEDLLGVPHPALRVDVPHHPETWRELLGWYKLSAGALDTRARMFMGAGAEVFVRRGQLMFRFLSPVPALYKGWALHPDDDRDPQVFRIDLSEYGMGVPRVVFGRAPGGRAGAVHLGWMPVSLHQQPDATNPRRLLARALGSLGVAAAGVAMRRRRRRS